jgi:hypothetical protein
MIKMEKHKNLVRLIGCVIALGLALSIFSSTASALTWAPTITSTPNTWGLDDTPYYYNVTTNETCTFEINNSIATFLTIGAANGKVVGTPSASGSYWVGINVTSTGGTLTTYGNYTLIINMTWGPEFVSGSSLSGRVGKLYTFTATVNETSSIGAWSIPYWATDHGSGVFSGTPTHAGSYDFSIVAYSTNGTLASYRNWTVNVSPIPIPRGGGGGSVPIITTGGSGISFSATGMGILILGIALVVVPVLFVRNKIGVGMMIVGAVIIFVVVVYGGL